VSAVRFGVDLSTSAGLGADPVADARKAEDLGFDFLSASDHPSGSHPTYETWTMLAWIAASTTRIHIATRVLGVPYRPPAMVAKMAESFDRLSGGRLILGLGGGYSDEEFRAFGLGVPTPGEKITGLEEAIHIARGLWTRPGFSFEGRRYRTDDAELEPKAERRIPIWLGTFGPRSLRLTGKLADGWIPSLGNAPPEDIPAMRERIIAGARDAGRAPEEIACIYNLEVRVDERAQPEQDVVTGSPGFIAERLVSFTKLGFGGFNLTPVGNDKDRQLERLAREVIPAVATAT